MSAGKNKQSLLINLIDITCLFFVKIIIGLIYFLPYSLAIWICRTVVLFIVLLMPRANNVALRNLELVFPEKSLAERKKIVGFDIVEIAPRKTDIITEFTMAKLCYKILGYLQLNNQI